MDKNAYINTFIDKLISLNYDGLYKFFTKETIVYKIDEKVIIDVSSFLEEQKVLFQGKEVKRGRIFSNDVCIKYELLIDGILHHYYFEVKDRRISRIEISK